MNHADEKVQTVKLTGKNLILLLLYSPTVGEATNVPIAGRTRLMKMGFLFIKEVLGDFRQGAEVDESKLPEYFGWKYGPFSVQLVDDLEFLINQGYVRRSQEQATLSDITVSEEEMREWQYDYWVEDADEFQSREYDEEAFELGPRGVARAKEIWEALSDNQQRWLVEFKKVLNRAPLSRILEYVYKKYREDGYIDRSVIRDRYLA